jgi:hypothetical protein
VRGVDEELRLAHLKLAVWTSDRKTFPPGSLPLRKVSGSVDSTVQSCFVVPRSIRLAVFRLFDRCTSEGHMTSRSIGTALVTVLMLLPAAPASAQQAKCLAGKTA